MKNRRNLGEFDSCGNTPQNTLFLFHKKRNFFIVSVAAGSAS